MQGRHLKNSMKKYEVLITDAALQDMQDIYEYISNTLMSPNAALRQYNTIADKILTLETFPERIKVMASENEKLRGYRRLIVNNYSVFFVIRSDKVIVFNVLYSASDLEKRLLYESANNEK